MYMYNMMDLPLESASVKEYIGAEITNRLECPHKLSCN